MKQDFSDQRVSYERDTLLEDTLPATPLALFSTWMQQAQEAQVLEPYAMSLATCSKDRMPAVRIVLMREITESGVVFYSNYESAKGQDIDENPHAEVLFFWQALQRQVRIRGRIEKISPERSHAYFQKRPHDSQVGAWVSQPQSGEVASREQMETRFETLKAQYPEGSEVPTPKFWGGYEIVATEVEFWQGRANRMHDRILYRQGEQGEWCRVRLLP